MEKQEKNKSSLTTILGNLDIVVAGAALIVLIVLTFAGVVMRYIVGQPFTWLEEVQLFCMVWIVFAAGGAAFRTKSHVAIEMVVEMFPESVQKIISYVIDVVVFLVIAYLLYHSFGFIQMFVKNGRSSSMLKIPMTVQYGIAPVSYALMIISYFYSKYFDKSTKGGEE
ncbi:MAG: TRAP transporter small permease [Lachnospiraceae bacterium]|nr:TRAP transporter small permease [Lachnospiraceae bacterium]MCI9657663.1 TRAP transporter small permease [Lachnospiraceae bacterium]